MNSSLVLTDHERRILAYLDQRGGVAHRADVVCDLASADSRIARNGRRYNGSNGAVPMIMARGCARLVEARLVEKNSRPRGYYNGHAITTLGRAALRNRPNQAVAPGHNGGSKQDGR